MQDLSDEALMMRLKNGDLRAFEGLYDRHAPRLRRYFQQRQPARCEDLMQECFMRLLERRDQFRDQPFLPWLYVMARHLWIDDYRKHKSRNLSIDVEVAVDVSDFLSELTPEQRQLVEDRYFAGLSFEELAQKYGSSEVSLRKKLSRLLKVLGDSV
jgi:RNA polymerase sigma-70 factor (ECF subfamily)